MKKKERKKERNKTKGRFKEGRRWEKGKKRQNKRRKWKVDKMVLKDAYSSSVLHETMHLEKEMPGRL